MMSRFTLLRARLFEPHPRYWVAVKGVAWGSAIGVALLLAGFTPFDIHPDEATHVAAFNYFQGRWFPPPVNSDQVWYDRYGLSRVYYQEIVYIFYGNLALGLQKLTGIAPDYRVYRLLNIALLAVTLYGLLFRSVRLLHLEQFGWLLLGIPQIIYLYSYANSDAWALSLSIFLLVCALQLGEKSIEIWSISDFIGLGFLTGLLIVSKQNFLLSLILPYGLLSLKLPEFVMVHRHQWLRDVIGWSLTILIIAAPLKLIYPLAQGDYSTAIVQMRNDRAIPGLKPNQPQGDFQLADQGYSYQDLIEKRQWLRFTFDSFWGHYGYLRVRNPLWMYQMAAHVAIGLTSLTAYWLLRDRNWIQNHCLIAGLLLSGFVLLLNLIAALHHSLTVDYQPQGRYLFPSFTSIAFLWIGSISPERADIQRIRWGLLTLLMGVSFYSLLAIALPNLLTHYPFLMD